MSNRSKCLEHVIEEYEENEQQSILRLFDGQGFYHLKTILKRDCISGRCYTSENRHSLADAFNSAPVIEVSRRAGGFGAS